MPYRRILRVGVRERQVGREALWPNAVEAPALRGRQAGKGVLTRGAIETPTVRLDAVSQMVTATNDAVLECSGTGTDIIDADIKRVAGTDLDITVGFEVEEEIIDRLSCAVRIKRDSTNLWIPVIFVPITYINGADVYHAGFFVVPYTDRSEQSGDHNYVCNLRFTSGGVDQTVDVLNRSMRVWERKR